VADDLSSVLSERVVGRDQIVAGYTSDPEQVVYEYRRRPKDLPVDFALMLQRTPSRFGISAW
jgi:hypothetical protein